MKHTSNTSIRSNHFNKERDTLYRASLLLRWDISKRLFVQLQLRCLCPFNSIEYLSSSFTRIVDQGKSKTFAVEIDLILSFCIGTTVFTFPIVGQSERVAIYYAIGSQENLALAICDKARV